MDEIDMELPELPVRGIEFSEGSSRDGGNAGGGALMGMVRGRGGGSEYGLSG